MEGQKTPQGSYLKDYAILFLLREGANMKTQGKAKTRYKGQETFTTFQVWSMALTSPTENTYNRITHDPNAGMGRAILWFLVTSFIGSTISVLSNMLFGNTAALSRLSEWFDVAPELAKLQIQNSPFQLVCIPIITVAGLLILLIQTGMVHYIAGVLGGKGAYSDLVYASVAYSAPFFLVYTVISVIPIVQCLLPFLSLYAIYLALLALKVVHRLDWGKSIATYVILVVIILVLSCILAALLMGGINQVFRNFGV
jgi:hypothetical protein